LLLPKPWDQGSVKLLAGFQALATTSSGLAANPTARADALITLICQSRLARATRPELRQIGGF
jgi:hypothetical protein